MTLGLTAPVFSGCDAADMMAAGLHPGHAPDGTNATGDFDISNVGGDLTIVGTDAQSTIVNANRATTADRVARRVPAYRYTHRTLLQ